MSDLGQQLKDQTSGCRLEISALSVSRKLTDTQRESVANLFNADYRFVDGSRKILDSKTPEVRRVSSIVSAVRSYWKAFTIKYDDGIRLIRKDNIQQMTDFVNASQAELIEAAQELYDCWDEIKAQAKERLAELYVESDYDFDVRQTVNVFLSFPAIEPDTSLATLHPELYKAEQERLKVKFQEVAAAAEDALHAELAAMVDSLVQKLDEKSSEEGKKHVVKSTTISAIADFTERFKALTITNDTALNEQVNRLKALANDANVAGWSKDPTGKFSFTSGLKEIQESIGGMITAGKARGKFEL